MEIIMSKVMTPKKQFLLLFFTTIGLYILNQHILIYKLGLTFLKLIPYSFEIMLFSNEILKTTINGREIEMISSAGIESLHNCTYLLMAAALIMGLLNNNENVLIKFINFSKDIFYKIGFDYIPDKHWLIKIMSVLFHFISFYFIPNILSFVFLHSWRIIINDYYSNVNRPTN